MKTLNDFAKSKSNFVTIKNGENYCCIYKGYKFVEKDSFGETKEYARYLLEDLVDHQIRNLDSQSADLAKQMSEIKEGSKIRISRIGESMETKYQVEAYKDEFPVEDEEIPVVEDDMPPHTDEDAPPEEDENA